MKCQHCNKVFRPKNWQQKFCSDLCRTKDACKRYYNRYLNKQRKRCLNRYYKLKSTEEGLIKIRTINLKANAKRRFGIHHRDEILKNYDYKCFFCGSKRRLYIHHLDKNGRGNNNSNNDINNLVPCCPNCHAKIHLYDMDEDKVRHSK